MKKLYVCTIGLALEDIPNGVWFFSDWVLSTNKIHAKNAIAIFNYTNECGNLGFFEVYKYELAQLRYSILADKVGICVAVLGIFVAVGLAILAVSNFGYRKNLEILLIPAISLGLAGFIILPVATLELIKIKTAPRVFILESITGSKKCK